MSIEKEYLARESGIDDYDAYTSDAPMFKQYECIKCHNVANELEYYDVECDGDITGQCPKCGKMTIMVEPTIVCDADKLIASFTNGSISEDTYKKGLLLIYPDKEKKLTEERLAKGNKPKVYTRDFNSSDYQLGYVKGAHKNIDSATGSDK